MTEKPKPLHPNDVKVWEEYKNDLSEAGCIIRRLLVEKALLIQDNRELKRGVKHG